MVPLIAPVPVRWDAESDLAIIGAGAAGLIAALAALENGVSPLVFERDALPMGSTALSAGLIPAAGTRWQREAGIIDTPDGFARDIMRKAHDEPDSAIVDAVATAIAPTLEWLAVKHGLDFSVIENFRYPGHSAARMHGLASRSGRELIDRLRTAAEAAGVLILTQARVETLLVTPQGSVEGLRYVRPNGTREAIRADAIVLACNGYGGNRDLVSLHIPDLADALYFGHPGNQGEAVLWGQALGAATRHLSGHQGHGSVADPHSILITWATVTEGGFQVNVAGERFHDESEGYSEAAARVVAQPQARVFQIFDERIARIASQFEDFRSADQHGAVIKAQTIDELATRIAVPKDVLRHTFEAVSEFKTNGSKDRFGRNFSRISQLEAPFCAVKVRGALFHTQGGLAIDPSAHVLTESGSRIPGLYAAGGAACGVSGTKASGYLSGNGLLTAVALGAIAGKSAALDANLRRSGT